MVGRLERTKEENDHLWEAISGTFNNGKSVESKFSKYASGKRDTINNLLEKLNNVEGKFSRLENIHAEYKHKLHNGSGGGSGTR